MPTDERGLFFKNIILYTLFLRLRRSRNPIYSPESEKKLCFQRPVIVETPMYLSSDLLSRFFLKCSSNHTSNITCEGMFIFCKAAVAALRKNVHLHWYFVKIEKNSYSEHYTFLWLLLK